MPCKNTFVLIFLFSGIGISSVSGQKITNYNLTQLLSENRFDTTEFRQEIKVLDSTKKVAITVKGLLWLRDVMFDEGTIDIDIRGRNIYLNSFAGIAFHGKDKKKYDVVYFCPFRFDDGDTTNWYSVKYMSVPDFGYGKLRKEHPHVYENAATPSPAPDQWFHVTIVVEKKWIAVYVDHHKIPSLKVEKLPTLTTGRIGLWSYDRSLSSDFANLSIRQ